MTAARSLAAAVPLAEPEACTAKIGPNAVIQLAAALSARRGEAEAARVFAAAGLTRMLQAPPEAMVSETSVAALYRALFALLPQEAAALAAEAGTRTADYVLANRIPRPAQALLKALPAALSGPLLLKAIARNAWTFAGSGRVETAGRGRRFTVEIADNPLAMPGCVWHGAVFARLFGVLVAPKVSVSHPVCCHEGAPVCRFEIAA